MLPRAASPRVSAPRVVAMPPCGQVGAPSGWRWRRRGVATAVLLCLGFQGRPSPQALAPPPATEAGLRSHGGGVQAALPARHRRAALRQAAAAVLTGLVEVPDVAFAEGSEKAPVWSLPLPSAAWKVVSTSRSIPKTKRETIFEAKNPETAAVVSLFREPLGSVTRGGMADENRLLELADAFEGSRKMPAEEVVAILTKGFEDPFAVRARKWIEVKRLPKNTAELKDAGGRRYVRFEYETLECTSAVTEAITPKEACRGDVLPWRRHVAVATVGLEAYTPRFPTSRDMPVLETIWLLDASESLAAPGGAGAAAAELEALAAGFSVVPTAVMVAEEEG